MKQTISAEALLMTAASATLWPSSTVGRDMGAVWDNRCRSCHGTAATFAHQSLKLQDGVLTGRTSGRAVQDYLRLHGGLDPAQSLEMVETLTRVLDELGSKP
jgi:hypothetical protein